MTAYQRRGAVQFGDGRVSAPEVRALSHRVTLTVDLTFEPYQISS